MKQETKDRGTVYMKTFMQGERPSAAQKRDIVSRELNGIDQSDLFKGMDWITWDAIIPRVAKAATVEKAASRAVGVKDNRWYLNHGHLLAVQVNGKRVNVRAYVDGHRIMIHETGVWEESELKEIDGYDDVTLRFQQNSIKPLVKEILESFNRDNQQCSMAKFELKSLDSQKVSIGIDGVKFNYRYVMESFNGAVDHTSYYKVCKLNDKGVLGKVLMTSTKVKGSQLVGMVMPFLR